MPCDAGARVLDGGVAVGVGVTVGVAVGVGIYVGMRNTVAVTGFAVLVAGTGVEVSAGGADVTAPASRVAAVAVHPATSTAEISTVIIQSGGLWMCINPTLP